MVYPSLISKSKEFSQSISRIAADGDAIEGIQISGYGDILIYKIKGICRLGNKTYLVYFYFDEWTTTIYSGNGYWLEIQGYDPISS